MWSLAKFSAFQFRRFSSKVPTIFALSSGQGKCGVAVIRISGPMAREAVLKMTKCKELPKPRMASLQHIIDPETLEDLDKGLVLWFPGPKSFTGEDSCEFQIHGGQAVIASVLKGLSKIANFRPAEAGDFTKRAFFAGKLDLTEVEGLGDLIHAETEFQRKQALYQMEGNLGALYKKWRQILVKNLAHYEAFIDFSEEENIEDDILENVNDELKNLQEEITKHLGDGRKGERLRDGVHTAIIGEPNAGKSSLLNMLCQRPAAIVTPIPGTTRDIIELHLNLSGFPIILYDTAGLRTDSKDIVEREGIKRAQKIIEKADLILLIIDAYKMFTCTDSLSIHEVLNYLDNHAKKLELNIPTENLFNMNKNDKMPKYFCVFNKIDLLTEGQKISFKDIVKSNKICCLSCATEEGFTTFTEKVKNILIDLCGNPTRENPSLTQTRHRYHLNETLKNLQEYFIYVNEDIAVAAQKLRLSARHLGKIIGCVTSEEILDVIFKDFCIGK